MQNDLEIDLDLNQGHDVEVFYRLSFEVATPSGTNYSQVSTRIDDLDEVSKRKIK